MREDCCVVVPVYKNPLQYNANEKAALLQIVKAFPKRDLYFICPPELEEAYSTFRTIVFDEKWFTYEGYNKLCKSDFFYDTFLSNGYKYMCLVQLDVWVFQDNLDYFLNKLDEGEYDYIGAPWFGVGFCQDGVVGNGGFCIRKLETFRNICRDNPMGVGNEDVYFLKIHRDKIRVAPEKLALEFSWEEKPFYAYKLCEGKLPQGCHAYASTPDRITFWKQYIPGVKEIKAVGGLMDIYDNPQHIIGEND